MNQPLRNFLTRSEIASLSDADALTAANTPIYTSRTDAVTFRTLCGSECWGFAKAVGFMAALDASTNPAAKAVLALLNGSGILATDAQAGTVAATIVPLGGGTITADDAKLALNTISYAGDAVVTLDDITSEREYIADQIARSKVISVLAGILNEWLPQQETAPNAQGLIAQIQTALQQIGLA